MDVQFEKWENLEKMEVKKDERLVEEGESKKNQKLE
jgi:hypothetical protein